MANHPYLNAFRKALISPSGFVAVFMALVSFGGTQVVDHFKSRSDEHRKYVTDRVIGFFDTTKEFDALVATLANSVMDGDAPDKDTKAKIYTNLNNQYSEIEELANLIGRKDDKVVNYRNTLQEFNSKIGSINSPRDLRDYWLMLSNVLTARKGLSAELRKQADLEIEPKI